VAAAHLLTATSVQYTGCDKTLISSPREKAMLTLVCSSGTCLQVANGVKI